MSRHGTVIYTRFTDRHRTSDADAGAAARYVEQQRPLQVAWAQSLGLADATVERETGLIAFADTVSLGLCGALPLPLELDGPGIAEGTTGCRLARIQGEALAFNLAPWPFRGDAVMVVTEARMLPGGRFVGEAEMRAWSETATSAPLQFMLTRTDSPPDAPICGGDAWRLGHFEA